ncbi:MAG: hypothetical protein HYU66_24620 [Armatimonadetes bacterium]|nr:hypothetical protein [Armatimonadota bacterium]
MPISLQTICGYLDTEGLQYAVGRSNDYVMVPFPDMTAVVNVMEDGKAVSIRVPQVFNLADAPNREACLAFLANHNYHVKVGLFGCDETDGEVDVSHFVPVEDGTLTRSQFLRIFHFVLKVAYEKGRELRQVAFGRSEEGGSTSTFSAPDVEFDVDSIPEAPVAEPAWFRLVVDAFNSLCGNVEETSRVEQMRRVAWPRLLTLREDSVLDGERYLSFPRPAELSAEDEFLLLFMTARQAGGDCRILDKEIDLVYSPGLDFQETSAEVRKLCTAGYVGASDFNNGEPWYLTRAWLDRLAPVLPFPHEPLPPAFGRDDVPAGSLAEPEWLALLHRALAADAADLQLPERLDLLRNDVWPALLELRRNSVGEGRPYRTWSTVMTSRLAPREELVVAYVAHRAAEGDDHIPDRDIDLIYSPGLQVHETARVINGLMEARLVLATDNDGQAPFTIGPAGEMWQVGGWQ